MSDSLRGLWYFLFMVIDNEKVVTLVYTLSVIHDDGNIEFVERRGEENPLEFIFGCGLLLPKVEEVLDGEKKGFETQLKIKPQDAYGVRNEDLVLVYPLEKLPKGEAPQVGMKYQTQGPQGQVLSVIVTAVDDKSVTLDGNHPLADAYIQFDLMVLNVREATDEEMQAGEVLPGRFH